MNLNSRQKFLSPASSALSPLCNSLAILPCFQFWLTLFVRWLFSLDTVLMPHCSHSRLFMANGQGWWGTTVLIFKKKKKDFGSCYGNILIGKHIYENRQGFLSSFSTMNVRSQEKYLGRLFAVCFLQLQLAPCLWNPITVEAGRSPSLCSLSRCMKMELYR